MIAMVTGLTMSVFGLLFMGIGVIVGGALGFWIGWGQGRKKERALHRPEKDWKKTEEVTYEPKTK